MTSNGEIRDAVQGLYDWQHGETGFTPTLYTLIQKSDDWNRERIQLAFPVEFFALELWNEADDFGNDLFRQFGLMKPKGIGTEL